MSAKEDGLMIVLSSPSGAGKTTLSKLLSKQNNYYISVSHTTRKPRINETDSEDYHFVSEEEFKSLIKNNEFLEYAKVFNNYYGTVKSPVINNLDKGKKLIFDIDWQGTEQIKEKKLQYKLITFFILPPSKKVLFERLSNRDMKDKLIVEERMKQFSKDVLHWNNYDYVVINDNLENCYNEVNHLIKSEIEKFNNSYDIKLIKKHIDQLII
jgi:guanylate kinase